MSLAEEAGFRSSLLTLLRPQIALTGLSASESMLEGEHIDSWIVKGGKSMRVILDEIAQLQDELDNSSTNAGNP